MLRLATMTSVSGWSLRWLKRRTNLLLLITRWRRMRYRPGVRSIPDLSRAVKFHLSRDEWNEGVFQGQNKTESATKAFETGEPHCHFGVDAQSSLDIAGVGPI